MSGQLSNNDSLIMNSQDYCPTHLFAISANAFELVQLIIAWDGSLYEQEIELLPSSINPITKF
mgnify:CR=1 FL=1